MEKVILYKTEEFEGPLDLLLQLIAKNKLNIYDIKLSVLIEQYLEQIKLMQENDIIVAMSAGHRDIILRLFPEYAGKVRVFPENVGDFARGDIVAYQKGYVLLKKGVCEMFLGE